MTNQKGQDAAASLAAPVRASEQPVSKGKTTGGTGFGRWRIFWFTILGLLICFILPLKFMVSFALKSDLYSYTLLMPFVSIYLVRQSREKLPSPGAASIPWGALFLLLGAGMMTGYCLLLRSATEFPPEDYLFWAMGALYFFILAAAAFCLGSGILRAACFPLAMLIFIVPLPSSAIDAIDVGLQHSSAWTAWAMFKLSGTPVHANGLKLALSVITLRVAPECSGIHSSIVLLITSLVAGQLFLRTTWKHALLALAVVPLGILRNGFRIYTLGELCVHVSPKMIDSWIHHEGGPIFFGLSLIPLFLLLMYLRKTESPAVRPVKR